MLHDELNGVPALSATKTLEYLLTGSNSEGRALLIMEWTKSQIVGAALFQFHEVAHYLHNVNPAEYLLYGIL
jgi:hypothetical protein